VQGTSRQESARIACTTGRTRTQDRPIPARRKIPKNNLKQPMPLPCRGREIAREFFMDAFCPSGKIVAPEGFEK
jgi:hypothetical protein